MAFIKRLVLVHPVAWGKDPSSSERLGSSLAVPTNFMARRSCKGTPTVNQELKQGWMEVRQDGAGLTLLSPETLQILDPFASLRI
jgi:hypothetical protein